ncbi:hypothetical protein JCM24511_02402 [Saitozyma sp. JCM 24511]|nr:hypothetical protein JCM24511_02402 [Saitozyma sp. JCM 24511]
MRLLPLLLVCLSSLPSILSTNIATISLDSTAPPPASSPVQTGLIAAVKRAYLGADTAADLAARDAKDEADGVNRLTERNWAEKVQSGDEEDVWVVIIHGPKHDPLTPLYLETHTNATHLARDAPIPSTHWARLDFVTEPELCTRWLMFRTPSIVIVSKKGEELRFLQPTGLAPSGEGLYELVKAGEWRDAPAWKSRYGPGGDREWLVDAYIYATTKFSALTANVPGFAWMLLSGAAGQVILGWLWRSGSTANSNGNASNDQQREGAAQRRTAQ